MFSLEMTVQLEYINHLLQFFKNISYYAGIMLNAFSDLLCSKLCWHNRLVPNHDVASWSEFYFNFLFMLLKLLSSFTYVSTLTQVHYPLSRILFFLFCTYVQ